MTKYIVAGGLFVLMIAFLLLTCGLMSTVLHISLDAVFAVLFIILVLSVIILVILMIIDVLRDK